MFVRMLNDKLMQLEKGFTYPHGVPGKPQLKYVPQIVSFNCEQIINATRLGWRLCIDRIRFGFEKTNFYIQIVS